AAARFKRVASDRDAGRDLPCRPPPVLMADPVSRKVVEKGWPVYDREGAEVGNVHESTRDEEAAIFDGFGIKTGTFGAAKYVPAEIVATIAEREARLTISGSAGAAPQGTPQYG